MTITLIHKSNTICVTDEPLSVNKRFYQVFLTSEHVRIGDGEPSLLGATHPFYEPVPMELTYARQGSRRRARGWASRSASLSSWQLRGRQTNSHTNNAKCGGSLEGRNIVLSYCWRPRKASLCSDGDQVRGREECAGGGRGRSRDLVVGKRAPPTLATGNTRPRQGQWGWSESGGSAYGWSWRGRSAPARTGVSVL